MARFEHSRERNNRRDSRGSYSRRGSRTFEEHSEGRRNSRKESNRRNRRSGNLEMTKVICSSCGSECEVPFKPTSSKPVYCSDCFEKKGKSRSGSRSGSRSDRDLDIINEKLNKIMAALKIE